MPFKPTTALITGGGTGLGRGLAEALHGRGVQVIIAGRRADVLERLCAAHRGMRMQVLDVADRNDVAKVSRELRAAHPQLDCVINNAGMQRMVDFTQGEVPLDFADGEIDINLRGLMMLCAAWAPHLRGVDHGTLVNVTSGLAFSPLAHMPVYCATKAAVRSFTLSLRHQLRGRVKVIEVAPPAVQTDLHDYMGPQGKSVGIPLADFVTEAMAGLDRGDEDFAVGQSKTAHQAARTAFDGIFAAMNPPRP